MCCCDQFDEIYYIRFTWKNFCLDVFQWRRANARYYYWFLNVVNLKFRVSFFVKSYSTAFASYWSALVIIVVVIVVGASCLPVESHSLYLSFIPLNVLCAVLMLLLLLAATTTRTVRTAPRNVQYFNTYADRVARRRRCSAAALLGLVWPRNVMFYFIFWLLVVLLRRVHNFYENEM